MKLSLLPIGKLSVAYEAYLSSLGISTRSFVLKGELMDLPDLSVLPNLGAVDPLRSITNQGFKTSSTLRKKSSKQVLALTPGEQGMGKK
jgi:hypothetical protein